jgi:hypothetical protein
MARPQRVTWLRRALLADSMSLLALINAPLEQGAGRDYTRYDLKTGFQQDLNASPIRVLVPKHPRKLFGT